MNPPVNADLLLRSKSFALRIVRLYNFLPKRGAAEVLGRQMLRSGTSVGANYREAHRARSAAEFAAKVGDCLRELDETLYWIELLEESGVVSNRKVVLLKLECDELIAIFTTIAKKSRAR